MRSTGNRFVYSAFKYEDGFMNDDSVSIKSCDEPQLLVRALWDDNRAIAYVDERASRP